MPFLLCRACCPYSQVLEVVSAAASTAAAAKPKKGGASKGASSGAAAVSISIRQDDVADHALQVRMLQHASAKLTKLGYAESPLSFGQLRAFVCSPFPEKLAAAPSKQFCGGAHTFSLLAHQG